MDLACWNDGTLMRPRSWSSNNFSLITFLGKPCALATKQEYMTGSVKTPGRRIKNSNSSDRSSVHNHFANKVRITVEMLPEERHFHLRLSDFSESWDTLIVKEQFIRPLGKDLNSLEAESLSFKNRNFI
jgi:hypothetical protein